MLNCVSIPHWCDWKAIVCCTSFIIVRVSIPHWCDWKLSIHNVPMTFFVFQFLIGAIGRLHFDSMSPIKLRFQFLIGAIGSGRKCF